MILRQPAVPGSGSILTYEGEASTALRLAAHLDEEASEATVKHFSQVANPFNSRWSRWSQLSVRHPVDVASVLVGFAGCTTHSAGDFGASVTRCLTRLRKGPRIGSVAARSA